MSPVLPLPSAKEGGCLHVPNIKGNKLGPVGSSTYIVVLIEAR